MKSFLLRTHEHASQLAAYLLNLVVDKPIKVTIGDVAIELPFECNPMVTDELMEMAQRLSDLGYTRESDRLRGIVSFRERGEEDEEEAPE